MNGRPDSSSSDEGYFALPPKPTPPVAANSRATPDPLRKNGRASTFSDASAASNSAPRPASAASSTSRHNRRQPAQPAPPTNNYYTAASQQQQQKQQHDLPFNDRTAEERMQQHREQLQHFEQHHEQEQQHYGQHHEQLQQYEQHPAFEGHPAGEQQHPALDQHPAFGAPRASSETGSVGRNDTPNSLRSREVGRTGRLRADSGRSHHSQSPPQNQQPHRPPAEEPPVNPFPQFHQQYWPPPSRMTSTSTTAGRRGSPPPPETPATAVNELPPFRIGDPPHQALPGAAGRRRPPPTQINVAPSPISTTATAIPGTGPVPAPRPWTPTEQPGSYPHGPPTVWYGTGGQNSEDNLQEQEDRPGSRSGRTSRPDPPSQPSIPSLPSLPTQPTQSRYYQVRQQENGDALGHNRVYSVHEHAPEVLENDFQRISLNASPPPSYASLSPGAGRGAGQQAGTAQGYPDEKRTVVVGAAAPPTSTHPAFQNDPNRTSPSSDRQRQNSQQWPQPQAQQQPQQPQQQQPQQPQPQQPQHSGQSQQFHPDQHQQQPPQPQFSPPPQGAGPSAPPVLPEGWMAHQDSNSGAYYYIHIATSHTQWDPPTAEDIAALAPPAGPSHVPAPLKMAQPMQTPGFAPPGTPGFPVKGGFLPQTPGFAPGTPGFPPGTPGFPPIMSPGYPPKVNPYDSMPNTPGFYNPPPTPLPNAGIIMYNPAPVNGEYFGPYLRYTNMNLEHGIWYGSILLVTEYMQPPTVHIHRSRDLSPNPPQLKASAIYTHRAWTFFRYDIDLPMEDGDMWTYAISTPVGCTRYEFLVAARDDRNWRFISTSCNDFSMSVRSEERSRLGGHGFMWKDLMQKHLDCGGFHAQIGNGDQVYADRMWRELPSLKEWLQIRGKENRRNAQWTTRHEDEVTHAYFHYYTSSWDQPHLREALAQIPYMFQLDDHDIFEGFGSHPEYLQFSAMFKNIGRIGMLWYLLFQHHTTLEILHSKTDDNDLFTITGTGWHFIKFLGPAIAVVGLDTRSERNQHQVMAGPSYQGLFPKIASLPQSIQHAIVVVSVPVVFPRTETAEHVMSTVATGKKAMTGTYNLLGKVVGSAAGVIGAKEVVGSGFRSVKEAVGKHGLMGGVVNVFGDVDLLDDVRDRWTHESKDLERTYFIRTLQGISHSRSLRITFLSGAVHLCGVGMVHDPNKPHDHKTMYQVVTSSMVDAPPPSYLTKMLHNNKILYVPQNGLRSTNVPSDTKEDMMELFQAEVDGRTREQKKLMAKRGYVIFTGFQVDSGIEAKGLATSLAVDFIVQGEGVYAMTGKYGPVVVPRLEVGY